MTGVAFVDLLGASGFPPAPGILMVPLREALGWDRTAIIAAGLVLLISPCTGEEPVLAPSPTATCAHFHPVLSLSGIVPGNGDVARKVFS